MTDNPMLRRVTRDEAQVLLAECRAYLAETGMAPSSFGYRSCKRGSLISDLRIGRRPTRQTADRVRAWMVGAETGAGSAATPAVAARQAKDDEQAALDARREETARARAEHVAKHLQREAHMVGRRTLGAALQETMISGPNDVIWTIRRRWPELWSRVVETARERGALPGAVLVEAIERGLPA